MTKKQRCGWCEGDPLYEQYHDTEWGVPLFDDQKLFEFLILETFQAGLSWITVLRKLKISEQHLIILITTKSQNTMKSNSKN